MTYAALIILAAVIMFMGAILVLQHSNHNQLIEQIGMQALEKEQLWKEERQQLLDRIQANSFAEYKTAEVRIIKAQKEEKQDPMVEMV